MACSVENREAPSNLWSRGDHRCRGTGTVMADVGPEPWVWLDMGCRLLTFRNMAKLIFVCRHILTPCILFLGSKSRLYRKLSCGKGVFSLGTDFAMPYSTVCRLDLDMEKPASG